MYVQARLAASLLLLISLFQLFGISGHAQTITQLCNPVVTGPVVAARARERLAAGNIAEPPLTDTTHGFAWQLTWSLGG